MKGNDLNMYETKVKIDGMMCGMCESHINDAIRNAFSVKKVSASHSKGEADIISEEPIDEAKLREAITKTADLPLQRWLRRWEQRSTRHSLVCADILSQRFFYPLR